MRRNVSLHEKEHEGTFAEGLAAEDHHAEAGPNRRFSEGLEHRPQNHANEHEGSFAEGLEKRPRHREWEAKRRFSEGLEEEAGAQASDQAIESSHSG